MQTHSESVRNTQAGFSLLEVMTVTVLVGGLVALALPSVQSVSRETKHEVEVNAFFSEIRHRQEMTKVLTGSYRSTGESESELFPAAPTDTAVPLGPVPSTWAELGIKPPFGDAQCSYVVRSGNATEAPGSIAASAGYQPPCRPWFYMIAQCLDGAGNKVEYFASDSDLSARKLGDDALVAVTPAPNASCNGTVVAQQMEGTITPSGDPNAPNAASTPSSYNPGAPITTSNSTATSAGVPTGSQGGTGTPTATGSYWGPTSTTTTTTTTTTKPPKGK
jgi:prepilin-type N-terminal cleavage/methylation domain-containing protein